MKILFAVYFIILFGLFMFSIISLSEIDEKKRKQLSCNHDFKYKQDVWGHDGDVLMHQYECTKCGKKDYLNACQDKDKDWNHGKGDGKLCDINHQDCARN